MVDLPQSSAQAAQVDLPSRARGRASAARPRLAFVDGLRLLAALQMIQGHTLDALLASELRHGLVFRLWTFARGLTSTAFLFTAGVSFALAHAAAAQRGQPELARTRRMRRALMLITLGYMLRAPLGILLGDAPEEALRNWARVDVLQCIGVSLLLLELLYRFARVRSLLLTLAAGLGAGCFLLAARAEALHGAGGWLVLSNYLTARDGSLFPLLPATGYVLLGALVAETGLLAPRIQQARAARLWLWAGCLLLAAIGLFTLWPASSARVSPSYAALKLGLVLTVFAGLERAFAGRQLPRALDRLASETLFLYVSHVLLLYVGHVGLATLVGPTQSLGLALFWTLGLVIFSSLGALGYGPALRALRGRYQSGTPRPQSPFPSGQSRG